MDSLNNKNKILITVKYVSGNFVDEFNIHQKLDHVFNKAIKGLYIDKTIVDSLGLFYNGNLLNKSSSIQESGLEEGVVLILSSIGSSDVEGRNE